MYPELPTADAEAPDTQATTEASTPPRTPNRHNVPDVDSVDYEKVLLTEDEEAAIEEYNTGTGGAGASNVNVNDQGDTNTLDELNNASVTSNFTEKFFPPSPTASKERAVVDINIPPGDAHALATPSTPARSVQPTPSDTPISQHHAPPTQYVVNDPQYEDDVSTIANDTYVAKYMADNNNNNNNPNQLPPTPKTPHHNHIGYPEHPGSPDISSGASQPTHIYTYNKLPKSKSRSPTDQQAESSTSEESGGNTTSGKLNGRDNDDNLSLASSYVRFKGGSGWSRKNYMVAIVMTLFLLAVIGGLVYTFVRIQTNQQDKDVALTARDPNANGNNGNPEWTLRPTGAPMPTPEPTITKSNAPSPIGPSPRPTRAPTAPPTKRPTTTPSMVPTSTPTTPKPTGVPSLPPTMTPEEVLRTTLQALTSSKTMQAISIRGTPQQLAFEWLHQDPNFSDYLERRFVQRFALAVLYFSLEPTKDTQEALQTWMQYDANECTWFTSWFENRLACGSDDIFKFLTLRNINLVGTIPSELALLTKLNSLVLSNNALQGTIPNEFGDWSSLTNLDLRSNYLTGKIPGLRNVPNLQNINLSYNQLTGSMPDSLLRVRDLKNLDLTNNAMVGIVHERLCGKGLTTLAVDCDLVSCNCCTSCNSAETRAPVALPPAPPTPPPTRPPTPPPTPGPTPPPTPPPTATNQCINAVQVTKPCYTLGEIIVVNFMNCNPAGNDWIGIYPENVGVGQHFNPYLWKWSCNSQQCFEAIMRGTVFMDANSSGGSLWPLPEGTYRAWLFARGGDGGAYPAKAGSGAFLVRDGNCF